jgi:hypothetical protein
MALLFLLLLSTHSWAGQFVDIESAGTCASNTPFRVGTYQRNTCTAPAEICTESISTQRTQLRVCVDDPSVNPQILGHKIARVTVYDGSNCDGIPNTVRMDFDGVCLEGQKVDCVNGLYSLQFYNTSDCSLDPYKTTEANLDTCISLSGGDKKIKYTCV